MSSRVASPIDLARTERVLRRGLERHEHLGAGVHVVRAGAEPASVFVGSAGADRPLTATTAVPWYCSTKLVFSISFATLVERGAASLDEPVTTWIPEFAVGGKHTVTARHLMSHTSGLRDNNVERATTWEERLATACGLALPPGWAPGRRGAYSGIAAWTVLAEVVSRVTGLPPGAYEAAVMQDELGLSRSWLTMDDPAVRRNLALPHGAARLDDEFELAGRLVPSRCARGPLADLAALYLTLLADGPVPTAEIKRPQRAGVVDEVIGGTTTWGLGVIVDRAIFGRVCSSPAGNVGRRTTVALADVDAGLACSMFFCGAPSEERSVHRRLQVIRAIYADAGLVAMAR